MIDDLEVVVEVATLLRQVEVNARRGQYGLAFIEVARDLANKPLLTAIVPDGMNNPVRK